MQFLPKAGFQDVGGAQFDDYFSAGRWRAFKAEMKDFWFGDKVAALPSDAALNQGKWLWERDGVDARFAGIAQRQNHLRAWLRTDYRLRHQKKSTAAGK